MKTVVPSWLCQWRSSSKLILWCCHMLNLCHVSVRWMSMEHLWNDPDGKTKVLGENSIPPWLFHHRFFVDRPRMKPWPSWWGRQLSACVLTVVMNSLEVYLGVLWKWGKVFHSWCWTSGTVVWVCVCGGNYYLSVELSWKCTFYF